MFKRLFSKSLLFVVSIGLSVSACATSPRLARSAIAEAAADRGMSAGSVPGLAVMEIRGGRIVGEAVRGVRSTATNDPVRRGDVWHLGSNGKPIVTTLIAILAERGQLRWDDRIADRVPALRTAMLPAYRDVTLLDLATHRSGLPDNVSGAYYAKFYGDRRPLPAQRLDYLARAFGEPPAVPRGGYNYSNSAFLALGAAAEQATGKSVEDLLRTMIFRPLRMKTAGFGATRSGQPLGHEKGRPLVGELADNPAMLTPAGTIHMSMNDWARFAIDQLKGARGRGVLLSGQSYRFLQAPQFTPPGRSSAVAVDWGVRQEAFGPLLMHSGSNTYWFALIGLAPDIDSAVLVAANAAEDAKGEVVTGRAFNHVWRSWAADVAKKP